MPSPFSSATDIANRALQSVGSERIAAGTLFTGTTKRHTEVAACYHQLRTAELRRNVWVFSIRTAVLRPISSTTMQLVPSAYSSSKGYIIGSVVSYLGLTYIGIDPKNTNNQPDISPASWTQYFGPMTVNLFDSTTTYFAGELVYTPVSQVYAVYLSLQTGNADVPTTIPAWAATTTYERGDTVVQSAVNYQSNIDLNLNNTPSTLTPFDIAHSYSIGNIVIGSDNHKYTSLANANVGNDPTTDGGVNWTDNGAWPWIVIPGTQPDQMQGQNWLKLDATVQAIRLLYPPNSGPVGVPATRNLYQLPNGYLREAPQDPKAGSAGFLGAVTGRQYDDWEFQDNYIVTRESRPIVFRFAADIADVSKYDSMFCEGLAARIGVSVVEALTQSSKKKADLASAYNLFMKEARIVNGIEAGPVEASVDDYLAVRN